MAQTPFASLSRDVVIQIFTSYLQPEEVFCAACVCKSWRLIWCERGQLSRRISLTDAVGRRIYGEPSRVFGGKTRWQVHQSQRRCLHGYFSDVNVRSYQGR